MYIHKLYVGISRIAPKKVKKKKYYMVSHQNELEVQDQRNSTRKFKY